MDEESIDVLEPLMTSSQGPVCKLFGLGPKGIARVVVLTGITTGAALLSYLLPVAKYLPCPFCQVSSFIGWTYFLMWSVSFYPQLIINYRRKSVAGISLDYLALNVAGFACYSTFNLALAFSPVVQQEYHSRFGPVNPVELNDVFFGLHALLLSLTVAVQCIIYERTPQQRVSKPTALALTAAALGAVGLSAYLSATGERQVPLTWLDFCYMCSFVKMGVSLVKYIPQVHLNKTRRSTDGWSIDNVLLDLGGGVLSTAQLLVTCQVVHDYSVVLGNPVKFGLGLISLGFDVVFILQHYVWYRHNPEPAAIVTAVDVSIIIGSRK